MLVVSVNAALIVSGNGVFPNAAWPVLIDGAATSGIVRLAWARNKSLAGTIPNFQMLPGQRMAAKAWMAMFIVVAVVAIGSGIVAC